MVFSFSLFSMNEPGFSDSMEVETTDPDSESEYMDSNCESIHESESEINYDHIDNEGNTAQKDSAEKKNPFTLKHFAIKIIAELISKNVWKKDLREKNLATLPIELLESIMYFVEIIPDDFIFTNVKMDETELDVLIKNYFDNPMPEDEDDALDLIEDLLKVYLETGLSYRLAHILKYTQQRFEYDGEGMAFLIQFLDLVNLEILACWSNSQYVLEEFNKLFDKFANSLPNYEQYINGLSLKYIDSTYVYPLQLISKIYSRHKKMRDFKTLKLLLDNGADINLIFECTDETTALFVVNSKRAYRFYLKNNANPNILSCDGEPAYRDILGKPLWNRIKPLLIALEANFDAQDKSGKTILMTFLVLTRDLDAIKDLLESKADIYKYDRSNRCPLSWALNTNACHFDCVYGRKVFKAAAAAAEHIIQHATIEERDYIDSNLIPLFQIGCLNGQEDMLANIFKNKINCKDKNGNTPLLAATYMNSANLMRALLKNNADISRTDHKGKTALDLAKEHNNDELIALLSLSVVDDSVNNDDDNQS